jgi:hypothetical protein
MTKMNYLLPLALLASGAVNAADQSENPWYVGAKLGGTHVSNFPSVSNLDKDEIKKEGINLYTLSEIIDETKLNTGSFKKGKYLINFDKKEFVNKTKVPKDNDGWRIHPLPLLTCEGNDRGGSKINFYGDEKGLVGRWSRDIIGSSTNKTNIPKEFKEIIFDLVEKPYQY